MQEDQRERATEADKENEDAGDDDSSESYSEDEDDGEPLTEYELLRKKKYSSKQTCTARLGI